MMSFRTLGGSEMALPLQTQSKYACFIDFRPLEPLPALLTPNLAGTGTGPRPGIPAPAFFDGAPRIHRPRGGPIEVSLINHTACISAKYCWILLKFGSF